MEASEALKHGVEHLKTIFDLCDQDKDGCISVEDFRSIGLEYFGKAQEVDMLICEMDPEHSEHISFTMFCRGIESYLLEHHQLPSSGSSICSISSGADDNESIAESLACDFDSAFSSDDIYPLEHRFATHLSTGYEPRDSTSRHQSVEGVGADVHLIAKPGDITDESTQQSHSTRRLLNSSPLNGYVDSPTASASRESPAQVARHLLLRYIPLALPDSPSQGNTPAEVAEIADEKVSELSGQLMELTSKLEGLQEDHRDSEGYRRKLRRENLDLKLKLDECEGQLRESEDSTQKLLNESQNMLNTSLVKVRHESEKQVMDYQLQLQVSKVELQKAKDVEHSLKYQVTTSYEELATKETEVSDLEVSKRLVDKELCKAREQLSLERESWFHERESLNQAVHDRDHQIHVLRTECEDIQENKKRHSITTSDMGREMDRLKKELEAALNKNVEMQVQFLQEGKELLARNKESLAAEMDTASKEQVLTALQDSEELNLRLRFYIDNLLTNILEKHPELLEKH